MVTRDPAAYRPFSWQGIVGLIFLVAFMGILLGYGAATVEPGPKDVPLDGGGSVRVEIGKMWPWYPDSCVLDQANASPPNCYRETIAKQSIIKQPAGVASALVFSAIGLAILFFLKAGPSGEVPGMFDATYRTVYGFVALFMGPGAIAFHATLTRFGGWLDQVSMYLLLGTMSGFGLASWIYGRIEHDRFQKAKTFFFIWLPSFIVTFGLIAWFAPGKAGIYIFAGTGIVIGIFELLIIIPGWPMSLSRRGFSRDWRLFVLSFGIFIVAMFTWWRALPSQPPTDEPWHSLWHMIAALFVGAFYLYLDSQKPVATSPSQTPAPQHA